MSGILYVVGTPIGNLGDMSPRAVETLQNVDFLAVEDTRVTVKLRKADFRNEWYLYLEAYPVYEIAVISNCNIIS